MSDHTHATEVCCEECGGEVVIVCKKNNCADPLEQRRQSKGPVPPAPRKEEMVRARRVAGPRIVKPLTPERARQKEIGRTLKSARTAAGLSPEQLAEKINRTASSFSVWEAGGAALGPELIRIICGVLPLQPEQLTNELAPPKRAYKAAPVVEVSSAA